MIDLAPVLANPDDDTPREVLADALQERSDPLGVFIALQISLSRLGPDDDDERDRLTDAIDAVLLQHGAHIHSLFGTSDVECTFLRGFPDEIALTAKQFQPVFPAIAARVPVRRLRITHTHTDRAAEYLRGGLPLLAGTTVRHLSLSYAVVEQEAVVDGLSTLTTSLESLDARLDSSAASALLRLPAARGMRRLRLRECRDFEPVISALPDSLEELELEGVVSSEALRVLSRASCAPRLRTLSLVQGKADDSSLSVLLPALTSLRTLDLTACDVRSVATIAQVKHLDRLEVLRLGANPIEDAMLTRLFELEDLGGIRELRLGAMPFGPRGTVALARSGWNRIERLALAESQLDREAMEHVAEWLPPTMRELTLSSNRPTDEGIERLVASPNFAHLRALEFESCQLTDRAAVAIASAPATALRRLVLRWNMDLREPGCLALAAATGLAHIRSLDLYGARRGHAGGRALRKRFGQAVR